MFSLLFSLVSAAWKRGGGQEWPAPH